jgi:hypothetical protein
MNWNELLDQALLGTSGTPPAGDIWTGHTPEQALLKQLMLQAVMRRAGYQAQSVRTLPTADPAPPEVLAPCSGLALDWLKQVERTSWTHELIRDWCLHIMQRRKRIPHAALPHVLHLATKQPQWAPYLLTLVGERGRWLIARTEAYESLRQADLWNGERMPELHPAQIEDTNTMLINLRKDLMEGLAHE